MTKKTLIRIWIVMVIMCVMCFSDWSFAAEWDGLEALWLSLNYIVSVLAWIWILFAKLAWTFLTNNWVYGEILWWDVLLWKFWNVMKNIANFGLWFYFVYVIFKWLVSKEGITQNLKNIIIWLLVAWVWIQASWFFTAVIVDVSTITLATAGAFPSLVTSKDPYVQWAVRNSLSEYLDSSWNVTTGQNVYVFSKGQKSNFVTTSWVKMEDPQEFTGFLDNLMPNADDVSWPLYYIWYFILESTNYVTSLSIQEEKPLKAMIFNLLIQWWTTIVFAIEMFVLCILALIRLLYLWMFIIVSPIAVLLWCINKSWWKLWESKESFLSKFMKQVEFKSFFVNVFKPTIIVLWFWVTILFVSLMKSVLCDSTWKTNYVWNTTIINQTNWAPMSGVPWDQTYNTTMDNNLLSFTLINVWKTLSELIMSIITVLMVYFIIKAAVEMWSWDDFVSQRIKKVQDSVWNVLGSIPVLPVAGYDKDGVRKTHWVGAKDIFDVKTWQSNLLNSGIEHAQRKVSDRYNKQVEALDSWFNGNKSYLSSNDKYSIDRAMEARDWFDALSWARETIKSFEERNKGITLDSSSDSSIYWIGKFNWWLEKMQDETSKNSFLRKIDGQRDRDAWRKIIEHWKDANGDLSKLFTDSDTMRAYLNFFLGEGDYSNITNWNSFSRIDISWWQSD